VIADVGGGDVKFTPDGGVILFFMQLRFMAVNGIMPDKIF
jgi:hypothetical protein